jgi:hypothetical protein
MDEYLKASYQNQKIIKDGYSRVLINIFLSK